MCKNRKSDRIPNIPNTGALDGGSIMLSPVLQFHGSLEKDLAPIAHKH